MKKRTDAITGIFIWNFLIIIEMNADRNKKKRSFRWVDLGIMKNKVFKDSL